MPNDCELPDTPALSGDVSDMPSSELGGRGGSLELEAVGRMSFSRSVELSNPKVCSWGFLYSVVGPLISSTDICFVGCELGSLVLRTESSVVVACEG